MGYTVKHCRKGYVIFNRLGWPVLMAWGLNSFRLKADAETVCHWLNQGLGVSNA